jgi:hypothetical protein
MGRERQLSRALRGECAFARPLSLADCGVNQMMIEANQLPFDWPRMASMSVSMTYRPIKPASMRFVAESLLKIHS